MTQGLGLLRGIGLALVSVCAPFRNFPNMVKHAYFGKCLWDYSLVGKHNLTFYGLFRLGA